MKKNINYLSIVLMLGLINWHCTKDSTAASANTGGAGQGGSLARFTIAGNYLYSVDNQVLKTFSLANPANPELKSSVNVGFDIETIFPFKDKLFIGSSSVVYIFSIASPEQPQKLGTAISPSVMRRCDPVVAKDSVAYATLRTNGACGGTQSILAVYDIKDITNPRVAASVPVPEPYGLGYADNALYVCDFNGLQVFDISNQYSPMFKNAVTGNSFVDVIPYGNTLICWVRDGLVIYDISNRFNPVLITKIK